MHNSRTTLNPAAPATDPPLHVQGTGRYVLLVLGSKEGDCASFPLPERGTVTVGRSRDTDIRIDDTSISRKHARLHIGAVIEVEDLGSANGTRLREGRLLSGSSADFRDTAEWAGRGVEPGTRVLVSPGDVIEFGAAVVMIQRAVAEQRPRKLWSHACFAGRLDEECARADKARTPFAVVRVHAGQSAQAETEEGIAAATRAQDVVASYGPGEYEVIVVDADEATGEAIGRRLEKELGARGVQARCAIAWFPKDGRSAEALLAKASSGALGTTAEVPATDASLIVISPAMQRLHGIAARVANGTICVLLLGETGVGKEVLAERIHRLSPRADKPFVCLNCAALPENLLESELFGHERGAFTGATSAKPGLLESANGGTVFLDEIGELPLTTQGKLLRVLEAKEVLRVGAVKSRPINVRFIAATNRDLEAEAGAGRFREDLFFRVSGVSLVIPPLRERPEEIEPMARTFLAKTCRELGRDRQVQLSAEALGWLQHHAWPGNVRELRNVIERAVLLCTGEVITLEHLPADRNTEVSFRTLRSPAGSRATREPKGPPPPKRAPVPTLPPRKPTETDDALRQMYTEDERAAILHALETCAGNQTRAAAMLGISRRTLVSRLGDFELPRPRKP